MASFKHHGVKGMHWGVRRYRNYDGTLTDLEKTRNRVRKNSKTKNDVDDIIRNLNNKDKRFLGLDKPDEEYLTVEQGEYVIKRIIEKEGDTPIAFFDVLSDGNNATISLAVRSDKQGKGYGKKIAQKGSDWIDKNLKNFDNIIWAVKPENKASAHLAEKYGFIRYEDEDDDKYKAYAKSKRFH